MSLTNRLTTLGLISMVAIGCTDHGLKIHEEPPTATVLSPGDNETFLEGLPITFRAQLDDNDDGVSSLEVAWRSDTMGTLRGEASLSDAGVQEFVTDDLELGSHLITLTATDPDGNSSEDDVAVSVVPNSPPSIGFSLPADNAAFGIDDDVVVIVVVDDAEEDQESLRLTWSLNDVPQPDAPGFADSAGEGMLVLSGLDYGAYTIKTRVTDTQGELAEATVTLRVIPLDGDGDGINTGELGGEDCDDDNPDIGPGATEVCDGVDNDCDELIDAEDDDVVDAIEGHPDIDGDGYGDDSTTILTCDLADLSDVGGDCNDLDASMNPGAMEVCGDGLDNDCDGTSGACKWTGDTPISSADYVSYGTGVEDETAQSLAGGDLNGDGYDDLVIGSAFSDGDETNSGAVYIIDGPLEETVGTVDTQAYAMIEGLGANSETGFAIAVSDFNVDDATDLSIGAPVKNISGIGANTGEVYIFFGGITGDTDTDAADVVISGASPGYRFGDRITAGGDLDGDGLADTLITSIEDSTYDSDAGAVDIFMGAAEPWTSSMSVDDSDTKITANDNDLMFGYAIEYVGDVNGDGRDDVIIGSPGSKEHGINTGAAYLFIGHPTSFSTGASRFHTAADATYNGVAMRDWAGEAITGLGDIDADGYAEFAISAPRNDDNAASSGAVYMMIDPERTGVHELDVAADTILRGPRSTDRIGESLNGNVDLDNDGILDLIVGSPQVNNGGNSNGRAFLLYGPLQDLPSGDLGEDFGIEDGSFAGEVTQDRAGTVVLGHDWTDDGVIDLAVTAPGASFMEVSDPGGVFIFFGRGM